MTVRFIIIALVVLALPAAAPSSLDTTLSQLHFRNIGPLDGRIDAVSGVEGNPTLYYAAGLGGLFRSTDAGTTWSSIFDDKPVSSVSAIAVAPSRPATIYIGTGEANLRNDIAYGDGVWRSDDGGTTWNHLGLDATEQISQVAVDPSDPNIAYVAALGNAYRPSAERGIYRTSNGGATWQRVLYTDDRTGASSIAIDPADARHLIAGMWEGWRTPYHLTSGGSTDGIYESRDGGDHWKRLLGKGLPSGTMGRIAIAFAPSDPRRVYALIESAQGSLWRSDDGGVHWKMVNASHGINQRPFYFTSFTIDPKDAEHLYFMSVEMWQSSDGGATAKPMSDTRAGDYHQLWIDPQNPARMIAGADDDAEITNSAGATWLTAPIAIAQSYHVDVDDRVPYTICTEDQDEGSACGPSNSLVVGGIAPNAFYDAGGGESAWILFDRSDPDVIYADSYGGNITRFDRRTGEARRINVWPEDPMGWAAAGLRYRFQWSAPLAVSPLYEHRLYMGANKLFQTDDGGTMWTAISPDLTRNDKSRQQISGTPITPDNTSVEYYDVIFCIGPSRLRRGEIWVGTDDGLVWLTRDGGRHWANVTPHAMRSEPAAHWLRVDYVAPSPFDPATAYLAADAHKWGDRKPYLFVTHDYGRIWSAIAASLPQDSYTRMIRPDPVRRGMLYAGTETALWYSYDGGSHWTRLTNGLPVAPIYDFKIQRRFDDLVVGTHGRAIWILDDLHPLQEMSPAIQSEPLHLFTLRNAYRFRIGDIEDRSIRQPSEFAGENPQYGADVSFWLGNANASVRLQILDGTRVIRTIEVKNSVVGVNRVWWNLRYDAIKPVDDYIPWAGGGFAGPLVTPGTYLVRVLANGRAVHGDLRVLEDPRSRASLSDLHAQLAFLLRIRADLIRMTAAIEHVRDVSARNPEKKAKADALLHEMYDPEVTQSEDALRYPDRVYGRLSYLASAAASADAAPTKSEYEVLRLLEAQAVALDDAAGKF